MNIAAGPGVRLDAEATDALAEMINIGSGLAAAALSDLIGMRIELTVPTIRLMAAADLAGEAPPLSTTVVQEFAGDICGCAALMFPRSSGIVLAQLLMGEEEARDELDIELTGVLLEVGNIVLNGVLGSLSNAIRANFCYSVPELVRSLTARVAGSEETEEVLVADVQFSVEQKEVRGTVVIVFSAGSVQKVIDSLLGTAAE